MGVFDNNSNKKYDNALPNYDVDDGVDIVPCEEDCPYKDLIKNRCIYETCIQKVHPFSLRYHSKTTLGCWICEKPFEIELGDYSFTAPFLPVCPDCRKAIKELVTDD